MLRTFGKVFLLYAVFWKQPLLFSVGCDQRSMYLWLQSVSSLWVAATVDSKIEMERNWLANHIVEKLHEQPWQSSVMWIKTFPSDLVSDIISVISTEGILNKNTYTSCLDMNKTALVTETGKLLQFICNADKLFCAL